MADLINLNRVRKKLARAEREKNAVENRVRFGRTKGEATRDKELVLLADKKLREHLLVSEEEE